MKSPIVWLMMVAASPMAMASGQRPPVVEDAKLYGSTLHLQGPSPKGEKADAKVCIAMGYTVQPNGSVGNFEVLDVWSSQPPARARQKRYWQDYGNTAAQVVQAVQSRIPVQKPAEPVRTVSRIVFGPDAAENRQCMMGSARETYAMAENYRRRMDMELREMELHSLARQSEHVPRRFENTSAPPPPPPAPPPPSPRPESTSGPT